VSRRSLLTIDDIDRAEIARILRVGNRFAEVMQRDIKKVPTLRGRTIINMFFEASTRTSTSFELAGKRLSADVVNVKGSGSSVEKGETLKDTVITLNAYAPDVLVIRHASVGACQMAARFTDAAVINAGDGKHEHPTQGLLDTYTLAEAKGRLDDFNLKGLKVAIVGDIASSRVARSALAAFTTLGAKVVCVGPPGMVPRGFEALGATVGGSLDDVLAEMDAVMMLRIQFERHGDGKTPAPAGAEAPKASPIASVREYREFYALTPERAAKMKKGAIVMHPGPINRGIELDEAVADGPRSVIMRQVTNGVLVRMAVLRWCLGA